MSTGAWILVVAVVVAVGFGLYRRATDGAFSAKKEAASAPEAGQASRTSYEPEAMSADSDDVPEPSPAAEVVAAAGANLGERATLLQFSSAFCAPCRATRRTLGEVAELVSGVAHVEIDADEHLDATRRLDILRTPTTIVLDAAGREVSRAAGAPTKDQVLTALARIE